MHAGCYNLDVFQQFLLRALSNSSSAPAQVGEWLSLVEHLVRDQGVGGSNPLSPTNLINFSLILQRNASAPFRVLEVHCSAKARFRERPFKAAVGP